MLDCCHLLTVYRILSPCYCTRPSYMKQSVLRNHTCLFALESVHVDTCISVSCQFLPLQTHYFSLSTYTPIIILFSILLAKAISCSSLAYISHVIRSIYIFLPSLFPSIPSYFLQHYSALFFDLEGLWKLYFPSFFCNIHGTVAAYCCRPYSSFKTNSKYKSVSHQILSRTPN